MSLAAVGDKITIVYPDNMSYGAPMNVSRAYVREVFELTMWLNGGAVHRFEHEGITWIRGHHADDSTAVQALLAGYALAWDLG